MTTTGEPSQARPGIETRMAALITDGDSGIGRAVAIAYAREGADVAITFLPAEAEDAAEMERVPPGDIRNAASCREQVARTVQEFSHLDILVNNAAAPTVDEELDELTGSDLEGAFAANVFAMVHLAKAAVPHMRPVSSIVNTTSMQGKVASRTMVIHSSTKGIRTNCVAPGPVRMPIQPDTKNAERMDEPGSNTPLGRPGQPAGIIVAFVLLASAEGSYLSGALIPVIGGMPIP